MVGSALPHLSRFSRRSPSFGPRGDLTHGTAPYSAHPNVRTMEPPDPALRHDATDRHNAQIVCTTAPTAPPTATLARSGSSARSSIVKPLSTMPPPSAIAVASASA
eukprot:731307-Prymnesium_polylepis.3